MEGAPNLGQRLSGKHPDSQDLKVADSSRVVQAPTGAEFHMFNVTPVSTVHTRSENETDKCKSEEVFL